jgi:hypothetical protein
LKQEIVVKIFKKKKGGTNESFRLVLACAVFQLQILSITTDRYGKMQRILLQLRSDQVFGDLFPTGFFEASLIYLMALMFRTTVSDFPWT